MTKNFKFLLLFGAMFSCLFFTACSDDDDDNTPELTGKYFSIANAQYQDGNLPSGSESVITDMQINNSVINGGSTILSLSSSEELKDIYISVVGVPGYYKYNVEETQKSTQADNIYEIVLLMSQNLSAENFKLNISAVTLEGIVTSSVNSDDIDVVEVGTGKLQVSLSWDQLDDVDLHLLEPDDNEIYYGNPMSLDADESFYFAFYCYIVNKYTSHDASKLNYNNEDDWYTLYDYLDDVPETVNENEEMRKYAADKGKKIYGFLDLDSNAGCYIDGVNNENITYTNVKPGTYTIAVDLYSKCNLSKPGAKYSVTVNFNGKPITVSSKQVGQFPDNCSGSYGEYEDPSATVIIGKFTIDGNSVRSSSGTPASSNPMIKKIQKKLSGK